MLTSHTLLIMYIIFNVAQGTPEADFLLASLEYICKQNHVMEMSKLIVLFICVFIYLFLISMLYLVAFGFNVSRCLTYFTHYGL